jgi:hypothetical protein
MPLPEGYALRKGDEVLIRARAKRDARIDDDPEPACYLEIVGNEHKNFFMPCSGIHSLYRRIWNEGDRVRERQEPASCGEVVAVHDGWAWVKMDRGRIMVTFEVNELEAAPEEVAVETITEAELLAGDRLI